MTVDLTGYKLTFDDEFDQESISQDSGTVWSDIRSAWRVSPVADVGFGDSAFVDSASGINPFSLQNGALDITAVRAGPDIVGPGQWASGLISTQYSFAQEYGYFEIRAMLPTDVGVWPAFWMLPEDQTSSELDVFEAYGGTDLYQTVHTGISGTDSYQVTWSNQPTMTSGYHTYGVMWDAQSITFYFDGNVTGTQQTPPDMHTPMYLLADLAMQDLAGVTDDPKHFSIDYIRAYSNDPNAVAVSQQPVSPPDAVVQVVSAGAANSGVVVTSGNVLEIRSGGVAYGTQVASGGSEAVGGMAAWDIVRSGATQAVSAGGLALDGSMSGATATISAGGIAENMVLSGATAMIDGLAINAIVGGGSIEDLSPTGATEFTVVNSGGVENVAGSTIWSTVNSGGVENVLPGGRANGTTIAGGRVEVASGGLHATVTFTTNGGILQLDHAASFAALWRGSRNRIRSICATLPSGRVPRSRSRTCQGRAAGRLRSPMASIRPALRCSGNTRPRNSA
jgi:autotransporter passenger strand-loop-strand repeat protein